MILITKSYEDIIKDTREFKYGKDKIDFDSNLYKKPTKAEIIEILKKKYPSGSFEYIHQYLEVPENISI